MGWMEKLGKAGILRILRILGNMGKVSLPSKGEVKWLRYNMFHDLL